MSKSSVKIEKQMRVFARVVTSYELRVCGFTERQILRAEREQVIKRHNEGWILNEKK